MIYLSKPNGTHAVFNSQRSQGAYEVYKLEPGHDYVRGPSHGSFVGEREHYGEAVAWADTCDQTCAARS